MRQPPSLALRVTLLFGIAAAIVFPIFGWVIDRSISNHFTDEDAAELKIITSAAQQVLSVTRHEDPPTMLEQQLNGILTRYHSASLFIVTQDGRSLFASPGLDLSALTRTTVSRHNSISQWHDAGHTYRVLSQHFNRDDGPPYTVIATMLIDHHIQFLEAFRQTLWLITIIAIALMSLLGWIAVRQGHTPLHRIVAQIRQTSANELNARLSPETMPRELTDLAVSFNEMLNRLEESFARLSNFSADIAHELRTPVANLMTQTQVALSQPRSLDEYRETLYSSIEEYERMAQMIGDMLFLAQADNGLYTLNETTVDLNKEVQSLLEYYELWADEHRVALMLEQQGDTTVSGDRLMLRRALSNLLTNAIHHTPINQTVRIKLESSSHNEIGIVVSNPGPPIPAEHLPRLFDRFYRVDPSRQRSGEGAGLGLAIVKSIVEVHGGSIEVTSTRENTQFRMTLHRRRTPNN